MFNLPLGSRTYARCDGATRRSFLQVGGLGALGLTLGGMLRAEDAAKADAKTAVKKSGPQSNAMPRAKSIILVYLGGGLSHHDSFDLKPAAPEEIRGKYKPIASNVPGLQVGELLPKLAQSMNRVTLIRSGAHNNDHHETATNWVLSGRFGSAFGDYPAMGAVAAHEFGFSGTLPPYMAIPRNPSFTWELGRSAYLGGRYESFKTGDPNDKQFRVPDVTMSENLSDARVKRRQSLLAAVDGLARDVHNNDLISTYDEFHARAANIILSSDARRAFAIDQEPAKLRDEYGRSTFGQGCLLARRLVEHGVRFVTINSGGWDHHAKIWEGLDRMLPDFDRGLAALLGDLDGRGMLKDTMVAVFGEFGRTPKLNKDVGRDHWGPAASMLFAGAGVARGSVIGATDKEGAFVTTKPVRPADVATTIFTALGIDSRKMLVDPAGRAIPILEEGEVIRELHG